MKTLAEKIEAALGLDNPFSGEVKAMIDETEKIADERGMLKNDAFEAWIKLIKNSIEHSFKSN